MKVNSFQHINFHNKQNNNVSKQKDTIVSDVEKNSETKKIAFYGLFNKKPVDAKFVTSPIFMAPGVEYAIQSDTVFRQGENIIALQDILLKNKINNFGPNQKMLLNNNFFGVNNQKESFMRIRKDKNGQLLASAMNKNVTPLILPNVEKVQDLNNSFKLNPSIFYEMPIHSALKVGNVELDLANYKDMLSSMQNGQYLIIGRGDNANIKINNDTISRSHCLIQKMNNSYFVKDLNSLNGVVYEKSTDPALKEIFTLNKGVPTKVDKDSQIYLGNAFAIDLRNKNILGLLYQKGNVTVGRSSNADVVVPEFYGKVSREHLNIALYNNEIYVTDMNSKNDTQVIPKNKIKPFYQGVENIQFGQGNIGDCFLLANLYALSRHPVGQVYLENMVKVDDQGNYVVTFYNKDPITVPLEQLNGQVLGDNKKVCVSGEMGIRAIERAYGKMLNNFQDYGKTLMMEIDRGGKIPEALRDLTGIRADSYRVDSIDIERKLEELSQKPMDDHILLCSSHTDAKYGQFVDPQCKFIRQHAYAIKNVDNSNKMVEIINPHNTKVSYFVPFCEFSEIFNWIHVVDM